MNTEHHARHVALIPAKEFSSRCENKNWKPFFNGQNLVEYLLSNLPEGIFDNIIVSTDKKNAEFPRGILVHRRGKGLSTAESPVNDLIQVIIDQYSLADEDYVWLLNPTSPLRDKMDFLQIHELLEKTPHESLVSVSEIKPFIWNDGRPLFDTSYPRKNTQDLTTRYGVENGQFFVFKVSLFCATRSWYSDKTYLYHQDKVSSLVDIDTEQDFAIAGSLAGNGSAEPIETIRNETLRIDLIVKRPCKEHTALLYNHFRRYDEAIRRLRIETGDTVIDASCGLGYGSYIVSLKAKNVYGLDVHADNLEKAKMIFGNGKIEFSTYGDFHRAGKRGRSRNADKIICVETLEHMKESDVKPFIQDLLGSLRSGGDMFVTTPIGNNGPSAYNEYHLFEPSIDYLFNLFNGFFGKIDFEISRFRNSFGHDSEYCMATLNGFEAKNDEI